MANNRNIPSLSELAFSQIAKQGLFNKAFSFKPGQVVQSLLDEKLIPQFLQAVIDDQRETVASLLKSNPELLLIPPPEDRVIESQYTWQRFYAENAVAMAAKRHQIEMLKIMVPVLDQMIDENPELKPQAVAVKSSIKGNWEIYHGTPDNIPDAYTTLIDNLINVFIQDQTASREGVSKTTESALLKDFYSKVLPENPVALNQYYDISLLLYTAYKRSTERMPDLRISGQRDAFFIRVIGGLQKLLPPEDAKIICEGLYSIVETSQKIEQRAASLKLHNQQDYYPSSRHASDGLGFKYYCTDGQGRPYNLCCVGTDRSIRLWKKLYQTKTVSLQRLCSQHEHRQSLTA